MSTAWQQTRELHRCNHDDRERVKYRTCNNRWIVLDQCTLCGDVNPAMLNGRRLADLPDRDLGLRRQWFQMMVETYDRLLREEHDEVPA